MTCQPDRVYTHRRATAIQTTGVALLLLLGAIPPIRTLPPAPGVAPLVVDNVTVVDVEHGRLLPRQRVVIVGNRIRTMGDTRTVPLPRGARVVDARGKYLIPGLWDLHAHTGKEAGALFPLYIFSGITGVRDAGSEAPMTTLRQWRSEILAGTRVGPPRLIFSGLFLDNKHSSDSTEGRADPDCVERAKTYGTNRACVLDTADTRRMVDVRVAEGVDMIKLRMVSREEYFAGAAEARRLGVPFGGHIEYVSALEAADSGARIVDHVTHFGINIPRDRDTSRNLNCFGPHASAAQCQAVGDHFRRHGTWLVLTLMFVDSNDPRAERYSRVCEGRFMAEMAGKAGQGNWLHEVLPAAPAGSTRPAAASGDITLLRRAGVPMLAGTDEGTGSGGFCLHGELATLVAFGLTPLEALQTATLNPAKMLHGTDSLGTVAPGKLADLVLLDANPLVDITNTTMIRAVVANGRYFDRAALDSLIVSIRSRLHLSH